MNPAEFAHLLANRARGPDGEPPPPVVIQRPAVAPPAAAAKALAKRDSPLEERFASLWALMGGPPLEREYAFAAPARRFRFDFAHVASMTAIELEGGVYGGKGRHVSPKGFENDAIKYNLAAAMGWAVFRLSGRLIREANVMPILERCRR